MENYTKIVVDEHGNIRYRNSKYELHRLDGPAIEWASGSKTWYANGIIHRDNGAAVIWDDGSEFWYLNGRKCTKSKHNRIILFSNLEPQRVNFFPEESD